MLLVSSSSAAPVGRFRRWSLTRSNKKAQDQHFVRTNSGRWVKTEHPLIATDDEDDEARRRREQVAVQVQVQPETQQHDSHDNSNGLPFDVQHDTQYTDLDNDPNQEGPLIPPWHATRTPMHWNPYPSSNPADPVPTTFRPGHTYSHSHPSDPTLASDSPAEDGSSDGAAKGNVHVPPAPIPFPTPSYVIAPPKQEERRGRVRRKPGSLYPLHNDTKPPQPYINWHLRPPDLDLPPIFTPANYHPGGGLGSGAHGKGASTPVSDGAGQTVSANGSATGHSGRESRPRTRENSRDGRNHPSSTQPPKLHLATSAILGHSVSQASLRPGPSSALAVESNVGTSLNPSPTPSHSDAALPPHAAPGDTMQPHGFATGTSAAAHPIDPTKLDLADAWGTDWRYSSPYDLGQGPMGGLTIPAPGTYQPGTSPHKKKDPSPSPMGHRSRRASREPLDRSGRASEDRGRPSEDYGRPADYIPSPLSATPDKTAHTVHGVHKLEKKLSNLGRVFDRERDEESAEERERRKKGGLKALFSGSAPNVDSHSGDDGFMPRIRKRTISLGQTGIGIGIPAISGINAPRTRKQSFEVVRKPSVRPLAPEPAKPVVTEAVAVAVADADADADADAGAPTAKEPLRVDAAAANSRVLPDAEYASSPERSHSRADDGLNSARPSLDLQRNSSDSRNLHNSRDLGRSPSQSRFMISGPMPLRKSPSSGSINHGITQLLGHKKSTSHLGHGAADGIGLGRNPSVGSVNGVPVNEPPPRGRKLSNLRGPPRTLHRYAPNMDEFDARYAARPRRDSETSKTSKRGSTGGVVGKLVKKLSWMTKSKEEKERELEVEERMRQYEKERDLERRLDEAKAKATFEDEIRRSRRESSQDAARESEPVNLDDDQLDDMPPPGRPFADPVMSPDRVTMDFRKSDIQPALNLFRNLDDDGTVKNGIQFPMASPAVKPVPLDPRSPAQNMRRNLFQPPSNHGMDSPMPVNQSLTPLGKLAAVIMSKPAAEDKPTSGSSLFSPLAAAASLLSPKKAPSNNNLTLNLMSPAPSAPALASDTTPTKGRPRAGSSDGYGSSAQGHGRRPSRGPSPVPPRPQTPPDRQESPLSLPRMTLTLMNPDTPSPPTPVRDIAPEDWPSRRSISPKRRSIRNPRTPPKSPPRKNTVPDEVLQQRMERMQNMPWSDPITSESEAEKAKTRPATIPWASPASNPATMSPQPFPQMEQTPALGYGQFAMTPAAPQIPFPSFDEDSANPASTMSTPRASFQPAMPSSEPQSSHSQNTSSSSHVMSPSQSQLMSPPTQSQIMSPPTQSQLMSPSNQSQLMSPATQSQFMSPMSQLMSPPSDYHRSLLNYAAAPPAASRSSESLATYSPQTGLILQGGLMTTVAVMMLSPPAREPLEPLPPMQPSHNPVPAPPQLLPSPYTSGQGLESLETPATSSESEAPPPKERVGSSHAIISYEPAPPARPTQPTHSASDPLTPRKSTRPHPRRGDTIPAMGKQWEVVPDGEGHVGSVSSSSSKHKRRTSSRQQSGSVVVEDIRQLDPYEAIKERERQVIDEREIAREKARDDWERQRDQEKQAAREQRRREREAARERDREAAREREREAAREREREAARERERDAAREREREAAMERELEAAKERAREAAKENERQRIKELEASAANYERERERERRLERRASKLARSSTLSSIPPTPPPKERELRPKVPKSQTSSSSSATSPPPTRTPSRHHRTHHRSNTADSVMSQGPATPAKPAKLSKSSSRRESSGMNKDASVSSRHQLDQKPLPRPMSETSVDIGDTPMRSPRHAKGVSLANDRKDAIEHVLTNSMPVLPEMTSDGKTSPTRYQYQEHTRMMSPQSNGRMSLGSPAFHGSSYTSFSLQSPYMNTPGRPSLGYGYEAAPPREKNNPLPRPPRDISIDLSSL